MFNRKFTLCVLSICLLGCAQAAPYYYFLADPAAPQALTDQAKQAVEQAAEKAGQQVRDATGQVQEATGQVQEAVQQIGSQAGKVANQSGELGNRLHGHLSDLYHHGSSAVRNVVDNVQPDIKNIGRDMSDAIQQTGSRVAQTVRPYIAQANKAVSPYVSQAREEMPKLIEHAKPVLNKVGEQMRSGIGGVLNKIQHNNQQQAPEAGQVITDVAQHVQQTHDSATNSVKQLADGKVEAPAS